MLRYALAKQKTWSSKEICLYQPQKNQPEKADRWIEKGDRLGDYARDQLLAEVVAFANATGGTLIVGLHETKEEPRCAERLEPFPNCEGLAKRLLDATEDIIEPRLSSVSVHAVPMQADGSGFVLMRVAKSLSGPHRLTTTKEFYIRRGERSSRMTAREIRDHSLSLARSGDRIEQMFSARFEDAEKRFAGLLSAQGPGSPPLLVRATAVPMNLQFIDRLTERAHLWWTGRAFNMKVDDNDYPCHYPSREFGQRPEFRLRSLVTSYDREEGGVDRMMSADGVIEFTLQHPWRTLGHDGVKRSRAYFCWIYCLVVGAYAQIRHLQSSLAWDAVDYGLSISIFGTAPFSVLWLDNGFNAGLGIQEALPLRLPLYEVSATTSIDDLLTAITGDIINACGRSTKVKCTVPASAIMPA